MATIFHKLAKKIEPREKFPLYSINLPPKMTVYVCNKKLFFYMTVRNCVQSAHALTFAGSTSFRVWAWGSTMSESRSRRRCER